MDGAKIKGPSRSQPDKEEQNSAGGRMIKQDGISAAGVQIM